VGAAIKNAQVEHEHRHHKQVEKNPEQEHRECYSRWQVTGLRKTETVSRKPQASGAGFPET
jgi:hypothetical protein